MCNVAVVGGEAAQRERAAPGHPALTAIVARISEHLEAVGDRMLWAPRFGAGTARTVRRWA
jgi:hypothetical protein